MLKGKLLALRRAMKEIFRRDYVAVGIDDEAKEALAALLPPVTKPELPDFALHAIKNRADLLDAIENRGFEVILRHRETDEEVPYDPYCPGQVEYLDEVVFTPDDDTTAHVAQRPLDRHSDGVNLKAWRPGDDSKPN